MTPWKSISTFGSYIFEWLVGYSGLLGPVARIVSADFFVLRRRHLELADLYLRNGMSEYSKGFTPRAIVTLVAGVFCALNALVVPAPRFLCCCAWFVGFFLSAGAYILLMNKVQNIGSITRLESQGLATDRWACLVSRLAICCHLKISPDRTEKLLMNCFLRSQGIPSAAVASI